MNVITIEGATRADIGKKATKSLRKEGSVPCIVYGGEKAIAFSVAYNDLKDVVYTSQFLTVRLNIEGKEIDTILKDVDFHPVTDRILHVDFQELISGKHVKTDIPVKLTGFAKGVQAGGKIELKLYKLRVKATPEQLVSEVPVDVTHLELGKSIKVKDLATDLDIMNSPNIPIVQVVVPRAMRSAASKDEAAGVQEESTPDDGEANEE